MTPIRPDYLRLAVTGRCNLCCVYCRPEGAAREAATPDPPVAALRLLVGCAAAEGVRKVRITGGEPLLREDLEEVARAVSTVPGIAETVMTTNGLGLAARASRLRQAGIRRVNVSVDTLRRERMAAMAGRDAVAEVTEGVREAARVFPLVKTNTVVLRGWNDDELADLVRFAAGCGARARFIEYYPTLSAPSLAGMRAGEMKERLEAEFGPLEPLTGDGGAVEVLYCVPALGATVGLIASSEAPPCERCAKLRFSPDGRLMPCLFDAAGLDIAPLLAAGDAEGVRRALREAFAAKTRCGRAGRAATSACRLGG
jgi:cyclic pyranopterin phosphate synthase